MSEETLRVAAVPASATLLGMGGTVQIEVGVKKM